MRINKRVLAIGLSGITLVSLLTGAFVIHAGGAQASSGFTGVTRTIAASGSTSFAAAAAAADAPVTSHEIATQPGADGAGAGKAAPAANVVNRSASRGHTGSGSEAEHASRATSHPSVAASFDGLNHRKQRLANGGNQFSLEPPDQGLCANSSYELESLNDVLQVYSPSGTPLLNGGNAVDLNTFYGYPPAIIRSIPQFGQFVTDPSCYFDKDTQRWFQLVLTLETNPASGAFTGKNHLDLAVSTTSSPLGTFVIYRLPAQDDGTDGSPNHHCSVGPCLGDFPHLGADKYGFYITTNEYSLFGPEFHGAQIYAFSKAALAANSPSVTVTQFDTHSAHPGFTIWPATAPNGDNNTNNHGTEYFLSSTAAQEVKCPLTFTCTNLTSNNILQWTLTNTKSLNSTPNLTLHTNSVSVQNYTIPPPSVQKVGPTPLVDCLNNVPCATFFIGKPDPFTESEYKLDSSDSRMMQVTYADGHLWGALDTAVTVNSTPQAGVAFYIVDPTSHTIDRQGQVGLANTNLIYPAIGVLSNGEGVMAFTVSGTNDFPSAGYAGIDASAGLGAIHLVASGVGPADGFSGTFFFNAPNPPRPRWGDYGASAVVGNSIWIASEYIGQSCTLAQYEATPFGSCAGTRTSLANWDTRITEVTV